MHWDPANPQARNHPSLPDLHEEVAQGAQQEVRVHHHVTVQHHQEVVPAVAVLEQAAVDVAGLGVVRHTRHVVAAHVLDVRGAAHEPARLEMPAF
jgi:hypothetical protein